VGDFPLRMAFCLMEQGLNFQLLSLMESEKAQCSLSMSLFTVVAAERTRKITLGTGVTAPILRYNPALVAQAFATLGNLYPGRIFLGLGTGEAMNEVPVGCEWPETPERLARLEEAIKIIRMLWNKDFVSMKGKYYNLRKARLYTKQKAPVPIYVAANGPKTATRTSRIMNPNPTKARRCLLVLSQVSSAP